MANPLPRTAYPPGFTQLLDPIPEFTMKELGFGKIFWINTVKTKHLTLDCNAKLRSAIWSWKSVFYIHVNDYLSTQSWLATFFVGCSCCGVQEDSIFCKKISGFPVEKEKKKEEERMSEVSPVVFFTALHGLTGTSRSGWSRLMPGMLTPQAAGGWWSITPVDLWQKKCHWISTNSCYT